MKKHHTSVRRSLLTMTQALSMADPGISLTDLCLQAFLPKQQTHSMQLVDSWSAHGLYLKLQTYHSTPLFHVLRFSI